MERLERRGEDVSNGRAKGKGNFWCDGTVLIQAKMEIEKG